MEHWSLPITQLRSQPFAGLPFVSGGVPTPQSRLQPVYRESTDHPNHGTNKRRQQSAGRIRETQFKWPLSYSSEAEQCNWESVHLFNQVFTLRRGEGALQPNQAAQPCPGTSTHGITDVRGTRDPLM